MILLCFFCFSYNHSFYLGDTSDVIIPSVFIAQTEYKDLRSLSLIVEKPVEVQLVKDNLLQW